MTELHRFDVHYTYNGEPREHWFELPEASLSLAQAAMHLMQLHFGDGENSLLMPSADATPQEILEQAANLGIELREPYP